MTDLVHKIIALHAHLAGAALPHAFGGALALAWCTARARGTIDIDVNVFIPDTAFIKVLDALPADVNVTRNDSAILKRDGQARVWWDKTPVDLFLNTTTFHLELEARIRWEAFGGRQIPFLSCYDLAVFKAFFNRTRDWADLEEMQNAGTLDVARLKMTLAEFLGEDDERIDRLSLIAKVPPVAN